MTTKRSFTYTVTFFDSAVIDVNAPNTATACRHAYLRYSQTYPKQWAAIIRVDRRVSLPSPKRQKRTVRLLDDIAPL
jgi:hypothetical protein